MGFIVGFVNLIGIVEQASELEKRNLIAPHQELRLTVTRRNDMLYRIPAGRSSRNLVFTRADHSARNVKQQFRTLQPKRESNVDARRLCFREPPHRIGQLDPLGMVI